MENGNQMFELLKTLPSLGVGGVLAAFVFWFYQKHQREDKDRWLEQLKLEQSRGDLLIGLVRENTVATTRHSELTRETAELMRAVHRRFDFRGHGHPEER